MDKMHRARVGAASSTEFRCASQRPGLQRWSIFLCRPVSTHGWTDDPGPPGSTTPSGRRGHGWTGPGTRHSRPGHRNSAPFPDAASHDDARLIRVLDGRERRCRRFFMDRRAYVVQCHAV